MIKIFKETEAQNLTHIFITIVLCYPLAHHIFILFKIRQEICGKGMAKGYLWSWQPVQLTFGRIPN